MESVTQNNLTDLFSISRLNSYKFNGVDDNTIALERYLYNIKVSQALYPILSILEISLRNRLNEAIEKIIKNDWLIYEVNQQNVLLDNEHKKLLETKRKLKLKGHKEINKNDLIAELSLGFWVHLCSKKYKNSIWHKQGFFRTVFADYPNFSEFDKLSKVFPHLQLMLKLRNRVFHHEIIINHPYGIHNCYNDLKQLLGYISSDSVKFLDRVCNFENIIKSNNPSNST